MCHARQQIHRVAVVVFVLGISACAAPTSTPVGVNTARISIDGRETSNYPILCTQRSWLWTIETLPNSPGFTAMLQTGSSISPEIMRIRDLQGFTGSAAGEPMAGAEAGIDGTTFTMSGTAHGSFADRPTKPASVQYRIQAHC
ncbi:MULTISPECIES: lipoprotein LpqH [unclassified Mycolicibacterium]|uniref:lipoprotein LpqH n=1 Tax=unclassified Mycolicibacterium TaxID=2636767 RepID=UPI0012DDED35|nr:MULTISPECIES: lipoprotein LpqH [unclassified Mycolicibacterium]MUL84580.1 hypothetical protein [Mycolicibacterium sp. CBMA 329]MUL88355.1 hypothetical protein [Mycolicibacterium sp. CBMA 331]MUL99196.1 hypothetical protein [Mycolicibacterium sp. CBMA 334]MUM25043.1 hypothetical protein [Mycolicibacterium sp. CBMA 295]MUM40002.1 hypothetical protein [Mycolicibacterium sp. CBMA 247]